MICRMVYVFVDDSDNLKIDVDRSFAKLFTGITSSEIR